jgi:DNA-binding ferritin-like protein
MGKGKRGDDLSETLRALTARIQDAAKKAKAATRIEEEMRRSVAMAKAVRELNETKADVRREAEANLKEARQVGDLRRCVAYKRFLLKFEEEGKA